MSKETGQFRSTQTVHVPWSRIHESILRRKSLLSCNLGDNRYSRRPPGGGSGGGGSRSSIRLYSAFDKLIGDTNKVKIRIKKKLKRETEIFSYI